MIPALVLFMLLAPAWAGLRRGSECDFRVFSLFITA
jgi:hypothetical protein